MQATGQYGEVPQYVGSRVGASHGHMFNLSHEMSLSSPSTTPGQAHAHGHSLSLSHPPAQSQALHSHIQSQITSTAPAQPSFLQAHQQQQQQQQQPQQQHVQPEFNVSMGGAPPKTTSSSASPPTSHAPPQPTHALQSAAQQLQADIKQHQQQQLHQIQQTAAHDLGVQQQVRTQQQAGIQEFRQRQSPPAGEVIRGGETVPNPEGQAAVAAAAVLQKATREESLGDGEEGDEEGERGGGGNRWPRQEALALLKIRSEMDAAFRDSSLKGPLWEEVSRKLAEMGYQRSGKKCKEKFENVHKYYKRTKEGKTGRQDGKSYRFFSQLEALYGKPGGSPTLPHFKSPITIYPANPVTTATINNTTTNNNGLLISLNGDNPSPTPSGLISAANHSALHPAPGTTTAAVPLASFPPFSATPAAAATAAAAAAAAATNAHIARTLEKVECMKRESQCNAGVQYFLDSSDDDEDDDDDGEDDDDDDDDDEFEEPARGSSMLATQNSPRGKKRKRNSLKKYLVFFEKVMKKVLDKQEHMQQKFLEALERRDQDRMIREEAWKRQEMARLNREHDVRAAERALSASRDASLVALLQKMTGQSITLPHPYTTNTPSLQPTNSHQSTAIVPVDYMQNEHNADRDAYDPCSKRWPKPEVLALIKLRTSLDKKFHEPGSKAVLWEEISAGMTALGYSRTAKRCKEKWENINKYFKKAKESNKKRPENAKTCPYFHHLNALYKEGLLGGVGGGGCGLTSKELMGIEKASEEPSEGGMDQEGNTGNCDGESGQAQGHFEMLPTGNEIVPSGMSNQMPNNVTPTVSSSAGIMTSAVNLTLRTSSTSMDTKMHMFMGTERSGDIKEHAGMIKNVTPTSDMTQVLQPGIDLSGVPAAAKDHPPAALANCLPFKLDQTMNLSRNLPGVPATKQADQQSQS